MKKPILATALLSSALALAACSADATPDKQDNTVNNEVKTTGDKAGSKASGEDFKKPADTAKSDPSGQKGDRTNGQDAKGQVGVETDLTGGKNQDKSTGDPKGEQGTTEASSVKKSDLQADKERAKASMKSATNKNGTAKTDDPIRKEVGGEKGVMTANLIVTDDGGGYVLLDVFVKDSVKKAEAQTLADKYYAKLDAKYKDKGIDIQVHQQGKTLVQKSRKK